MDIDTYAELREFYQKESVTLTSDDVKILEAGPSEIVFIHRIWAEATATNVWKFYVEDYKHDQHYFYSEASTTVELIENQIPPLRPGESLSVENDVAGSPTVHLFYFRIPLDKLRPPSPAPFKKKLWG